MTTGFENGGFSCEVVDVVLLEKPTNNRHNNTQHNTDDNHRGDGRVKAKTGSFYPDVAGQVAQPA